MYWALPKKYKKWSSRHSVVLFVLNCLQVSTGTQCQIRHCCFVKLKLFQQLYYQDSGHKYREGFHCAWFFMNGVGFLKALGHKSLSTDLSDLRRYRWTLTLGINHRPVDVLHWHYFGKTLFWEDVLKINSSLDIVMLCFININTYVMRAHHWWALRDHRFIMFR